MTIDHPPRHPTAAFGCNGLVLRLLMPLLLAAIWFAAPPEARADGCDGCSTPTLVDLKKVPGFKLEKRPAGKGMVRPDYYLLSKGECKGTLTKPPEISIEDEWLEPRAQGEVWHCPHSKSVDTITVESAQANSTEWSFSVTLGAELGPVGAIFKREVEMGNTTGTTVTEVTRISKTITPTYCHRIQWKAYFRVATVKAVGEYTFKQHWAWWTKNISTGSTQVHAKGDIYMDCGGGELVLGRRAPIAGHFDLAQRGCGGEECKHVIQKKLGMFPPWPEEPVPEEPVPEDPLPETGNPDDDDEDKETEPKGPTSTAELGDPPTGPLPNPLESSP